VPSTTTVPSTRDRGAPIRLRSRRTTLRSHHIAWMHGPPVLYALDAHEVYELSRFSGFARIMIAPT
jgi:hypothetical protein